MANQKSQRTPISFPAQPLSAWDILTEAIGNPIPSERPEGSITASEVAEQRKCGITAARRMLDSLVKDGKLKAVKIRTASGNITYCFIPA